MPSGTSFFNFTLYRKNLTRFWPLWGAYSLVLFFAVSLPLVSSSLSRDAGSSFLTILENSTVSSLNRTWLAVAFAFALFSAMAVFGFLYSSRTACGMFALPMRREALFITSCASGLSFMLLPNLGAGLVSVVMQLCFAPREEWMQCLRVTGVWLLALSAFCFIFFAFAVFCGMFTGHILGLPAFYLIFNFLAAWLHMQAQSVCSMFLYGFSAFSDTIQKISELLTPTVALARAVQWTADLQGVSHLRSPGTIAGFCAAAAVFLLFSLLLFRRRHVERAGDAVVISLMKPLFRCGAAVLTGLLFGCLTSVILGLDENAVWSSAFIVLWTAAGYVIAEMVLRRSFRVLSAWKGCAAVSCVMLLFCLSLAMDWYGFETRVPSVEDTVSITLNGAGFYSNTQSVEDKELMDLAADLHRSLVDAAPEIQEAEDPDGWVHLELAYQTKSGSTVLRSYYIPTYRSDLKNENSVTAKLDQFYNDPRVRAIDYSLEWWSQQPISSIYVEGVRNPASDFTDYEPVYVENASQSEMKTLWDAIQEDFSDGTLGKYYLFSDIDENQYDCLLCIERRMQQTALNGTIDPRFLDPVRGTWSVTLTPQAEHVLKWLTDHGVFSDTCQPAEVDLATGSVF